jgi:hypothetical protein
LFTNSSNSALRSDFPTNDQRLGFAPLAAFNHRLEFGINLENAPGGRLLSSSKTWVANEFADDVAQFFEGGVGN